MNVFRALCPALLGLAFLSLPGCDGFFQPEPKELVVALVDTPASQEEYRNGVFLALKMHPVIKTPSGPVTIKLVSATVHSSQAEAGQGMRSTIETFKAKAVIGADTARLLAGMAKTSEALGIPLLSQATVSTVSSRKFTFLTKPPLSISAEAAIYFVLHDLQVARPGILFDIDDHTSALIAANLHDQFSRMGGKDILVLPYRGAGMLQARQKEMVAANRQLIFLASPHPRMYKMAEELQEQGYTGALFSPSTRESFYPEASAAAPDIPVYFLFFWAPEDPNETNTALKKAAAAEGIAVTEPVALSFDTTLRLIKALENSSGLEPEDIRNALAGLDSMRGAAGKYIFSANQTRKTCWIYKVQNGRLSQAAMLTPQARPDEK